MPLSHAEEVAELLAAIDHADAVAALCRAIGHDAKWEKPMAAIDQLPNDLHPTPEQEWAVLLDKIAVLPDLDLNRLVLTRGPQVLEALAASLEQHRAHGFALAEAVQVLDAQNAYITVLEQQLAQQDAALPEAPAAAPSALGAEFELLVHRDRAGMMTSMSAPSIRARFEFRRDGANVIRKIRALPMA